MYVPGENMKTIPSKDIRWTYAPEYPSCQTIHISSYFDFNTAPPKQIFFLFNRLENLRVSLHVVERNKALRRPLKVKVCHNL